MNSRKFRFLVPFFCLLTSLAQACDICGCYSPDGHCIMPGMQASLDRGAAQAGSLGRPFTDKRGFFFAVAEQFTHFGSLQFESRAVANPTNQRLDSFITQFVLGYALNDRFSLHVNLPSVYRDFRRPEGFKTDAGSLSGIGDLSVIGNFVVWRKETSAFSGALRVLGGVKFPTGSASRLNEELHETEVAGAPESGIHGHDLALGSGSYDGIVGSSFHLRYKRAFFSGAVQYSIRSEGAIGYRYADDLSWNFGPGAYLFLNEKYAVALQANVSGERKDLDTFRGQPAADTGVTGWYAGPEIVATYKEKISAEFGVDVPVEIRNTALQSVPDYRLRAAVTVRF